MWTGKYVATHEHPLSMPCPTLKGNPAVKCAPSTTVSCAKLEPPDDSIACPPLLCMEQLGKRQMCLHLQRETLAVGGKCTMRRKPTTLRHKRKKGNGMPNGVRKSCIAFQAPIGQECQQWHVDDQDRKTSDNSLYIMDMQ